ncbi:MAG: TonB-dependent receptor [Chlorobi bacterium]|nr:TonB-dependent receptor [Chlorobiota bacterium]
MKRLQFIILSLITVIQLNAHNFIEGKVVDKENDHPLPGVNISLKGTNEGCVSDEFGKFNIDTDYASGILVFTFLGYKTKELEFTSHTQFLLVMMEEDAINLSTINVTTSKSSPLESIAKLDIKLQAVKSSQEVLRMVPGLFIAQHAGGGKSEQIFLRGYDADHGTDINVSVDGMDVNMVSQAHGQGYADLHFLIPELIREIDFGKGPFKAEYGNLATAGHVAFKTKNMLNHNSIKLEGGSFNTIRLSSQLKLLSRRMNEKGKNAYVAIENYLTDGPFTSPQNFKRLNLFAKYNNIIDANNTISITASMFNSSWNQSGQLPAKSIDEGVLSRWGSIDPTEGGQTSRNNIIVKSYHNINSGVLSNLVYYSDYHFNLYSNFTFFLEDKENGDQIRQTEERNLYGYKSTYCKTININYDNNLEYNVGGGFRYDDINSSGLLHTYKRNTVVDTINFGDIDESNFNLFTDIDWSFKKWVVNLGLRLDYFKFEYNDRLIKNYESLAKQGSVLSPKLNIIYKLNKDAQLYFKAGKGFHSNDTRVVVSSDSLKTLPAVYAADLGFNFKIFSRLLINSALWYSYMEEELVWSGDAGTWEANGRTRRMGLDFSLRLQMGKYFFLSTDLNLCEPRFIDLPKEANYIPLSPVFTSTGSLIFDDFKSWSAALRYRYLAKRPADETNSISTTAYFVSDFNVNYSVSPHLSIGIVAENIFNSEWNEAQFAGDYRTSPVSEAEYGLTYTPGNPFTLKLGVEYVF